MRSRKWLTSAILAGCLLHLTSGLAQEKRGEEITVAAASDLSSALREVARRYEKKTGVSIKLSFGASGALTQQIENGAPFDVFFSGDMEYPRSLIANGQAEAASLYRYAVGRLVLWTWADFQLDLEHRGLNILLDKSVKKIAIANPLHAPYGRAAVAAMKHAGIYGQVADRLVIGENVAQAAQFVESGNAQVGFVALAHARSPGMKGKGRYWEIPLETYPPLDQGVVVLSHSEHKKAAGAFVHYISTEEAAEILSEYGFTIPGKN